MMTQLLRRAGDRKVHKPRRDIVDSANGSQHSVSLGPQQVIQTVSAVDKDDPIQGHYFNYRLVPEMLNNPNFTIKNNQGAYKHPMTSRKDIFWQNELVCGLSNLLSGG